MVGKIKFQTFISWSIDWMSWGNDPFWLIFSTELKPPTSFVPDFFQHFGNMNQYTQKIYKRFPSFFQRMELLNCVINKKKMFDMKYLKILFWKLKKKARKCSQLGRSSFFRPGPENLSRNPMNDPWHCCMYQLICHKIQPFILSKIEWDLTNWPLSKLLGLLNTRVEGSIQWVLLEISWIHVGKYYQSQRSVMGIWRCSTWNPDFLGGEIRPLVFGGMYPVILEDKFVELPCLWTSVSLTYYLLAEHKQFHCRVFHPFPINTGNVVTPSR